jgi:hypothetical protein
MQFTYRYSVFFERSPSSALTHFSLGQGGFFSQTPQIPPPGFFTRSLVSVPASESTPTHTFISLGPLVPPASPPASASTPVGQGSAPSLVPDKKDNMDF